MVFYIKAAHIVYAVLVSQSFLIASEIMVPIGDAFTDENFPKVIGWMFSNMVIILGWLGYARSVSVRPNKDTTAGAARFVVDLVILFEYFYLLHLSQEGYFNQVPFVVVIIFATYVVSDLIKKHEYGTQKSELHRIEKRNRTTTIAFNLSVLLLAFYLIILLFNDEHVANVIIITFLGTVIVWHRLAKWRVTKREDVG